MESKTSFFNKTIYAKTIRRFFPWGICYSIILLLAVTLPVTSCYLSHRPILNASDFLYMKENMQHSSIVCAEITLIALFLAALIAAMLLYSYLFSENAANMLHALPVSRTGLFVSTFLAGSTLLIVPLVLSLGSTAIFCACVNVSDVAVFCLQLILAFSLLSIFFFAMASFCAMLCGQSFTLPVLYTLLNFIVIGVIFLEELLTALFLNGVTEPYLSIENRPSIIASPIVYLSYRLIDSQYVKNSYLLDVHFLPVLIYSVCAVVFFAATLWLYKKRRIECAGDTLAFPKTSWIFEWIFAIISGVFFAFLVLALNDIYTTDSLMDYLVYALFFVGSAIGYFAMRMIILKKFNIFRAALKSFAIFTICTFACFLGYHLDVLGIETRVPDTSDILGVIIDHEMSEPSADADIIARTQALHRQIVEHPDDPILQDARSFDITGEVPLPYYFYFELTYLLKQGKTLTRQYQLVVFPEDLEDPDSIASKYLELLNQPAIIENISLTAGYTPKDLESATFYPALSNEDYLFSSDQMAALSNALQKDLSSGACGRYLPVPESYPSKIKSPYIRYYSEDVGSYVDNGYDEDAETLNQDPEDTEALLSEGEYGSLQLVIHYRENSLFTEHAKLINQLLWSRYEDEKTIVRLITIDSDTPNTVAVLKSLDLLPKQATPAAPVG